MGEGVVVVVGLLVGEEDTWSFVVSLRVRVGLVWKIGWSVWWWTVATVVVLGGDRSGVELQAIWVYFLIRLKNELVVLSGTP